MRSGPLGRVGIKLLTYFSGVVGVTLLRTELDSPACE
jgi:hypothetical protein